MREIVSWAGTNHSWADNAGIITSVRNDNLLFAKKSMVSICSRQLLKKTSASCCDSPIEDEAALPISLDSSPQLATASPLVWRGMSLCGVVFGGVGERRRNVRCQRP